MLRSDGHATKPQDDTNAMYVTTDQAQHIIYLAREQADI